MKKALCLLLVLLMVLTAFAGCREEKPMPTENAEQRVVNGVYATCGNYKYTIRTKTSGQIIFYLVTEKPLPEDAAITVDTESSVQFWIKDRTPKQVLGGYPQELAMWVEYGVDYNKYYDLMESNHLTWNDYANGKITKEEYLAAEETRAVALKKLNIPDLEELFDKYILAAPSCYLYEVDLRVKHTGTEIVKECRLVAGDMSRTIPIGEITLIYENGIVVGPKVVGTGATQYEYQLDRAEVIPNYDTNTTYLPVINNDDATIPLCPDTLLSARFLFKAENDITLTDIQSLDGQLEIKYADLAVFSNSDVTQLYWTPGTEVFIRRGEVVLLRVSFDHPDIHKIELSVEDELRLFYTDANGGGYIRKEYSYLRKRPLMEMYLWAFKGVDTEAFWIRYHENQKFYRDYPLVKMESST